MPDKQGKIKEEFMQMLAERDESIRQTFAITEQKLSNSFGAIEYRINICLAALEKLGITKEDLNIISKEVGEAMQKEIMKRNGGGQNDALQAVKQATADSGEPVELPPDGDIGEGGDEHFGQDRDGDG